MASMKHSTPKVSAYSVYTRNKKLTEVAEKKEEQAKSAEKKLTNIPQRKGFPAKEAKTKNSNLDIKKSTLRKRKNDVVTNVNGTATEEQVVKKKRGRKKKVIQEEIPARQSSPSDNEIEHELEENESDQADEDVARNSFEISAVPLSNGVSKKQSASCGNEAAEEAFRWLISPVKPEFFFEKKFDKEPFLIQRSNSNYYKGLYSSKEFDRTVKENYLNLDDKEIDVVKYVDGKRIPFEEEKKGTRVFAPSLWSRFHEGYSLRMRNPQVYHKPLGSLCSLLQEYFTSFVGANMYLTPEDSQGFPPHYDDIDAFILQIEGKKLWKLYIPSEDDMLARYSSRDLKEEELSEPCMEVELNPGDMLYFPRGFIHQAKTVPGVHSLHITLSTNQLNTWGDLLHHAFDYAVETATENNIEFRESIPKDYFDYMGTVYINDDSKERKVFEKIAYGLIQKSLDYICLDTAADRQGSDFIHGSMPPFINEKEKARSVYGNGSRFVNGEIVVSELLSFQTKIRFIRKRAIRLTVDDGGAKLYHTLNNSLNHKDKEAFYIEVDLTFVPALTELFRIHPDYIKIKDLPLGNSRNLLNILQKLYDNGILMTEEPLPPEEV